MTGLIYRILTLAAQFIGYNGKMRVLNRRKGFSDLYFGVLSKARCFHC